MENFERESLKSHLSDYLYSKGIRFENGKLFSCLSPTHQDNHPSMVYYKNKEVCHCFSCGANLDLFTLVGYDYGLTKFTEQAEKVRELYGYENNSFQPNRKKKKVDPYPVRKWEIKNKGSKENNNEDPNMIDFSDYLKQCSQNLDKAEYREIITDYIKTRGLTLETVKKFNCGFDPYWRSPKAISNNNKVPYSPRFIIPSSKYGYLARDIRKNLNETQLKMQKLKTGHLDLFNKEAINNEKGICFITEGEIDAMSIYQVGFDAIALGSTAMVNNFLQFVKDSNTNCILIPLLDNDTAGKEATEKIECEFKNTNIKYFHVNNLSLNTKDVNEALCKDELFFSAWIRNIALSGWLTYKEDNKNFIFYRILDKCIKHSTDTIIYNPTLKKESFSAILQIQETEYKDTGTETKNYTFTVYKHNNDYSISPRNKAIPSNISEIISEALGKESEKRVKNLLK